MVPQGKRHVLFVQVALYAYRPDMMAENMSFPHIHLRTDSTR